MNRPASKAITDNMLRTKLTKDDVDQLMLRHAGAVRTCVVRAIAKGCPLEYVTLLWHHPSHGYYLEHRAVMADKHCLDLGSDGFIVVMSRMQMSEHCEQMGKVTAAHKLEDITQSASIVPLVMLCACTSNGTIITRMRVTPGGDITYLVPTG